MLSIICQVPSQAQWWDDACLRDDEYPGLSPPEAGGRQDAGGGRPHQGEVEERQESVQKGLINILYIEKKYMAVSIQKLN